MLMVCFVLNLLFILGQNGHSSVTPRYSYGIISDRFDHLWVSLRCDKHDTEKKLSICILQSYNNFNNKEYREVTNYRKKRNDNTYLHK